MDAESDAGFLYDMNAAAIQGAILEIGDKVNANN